MSFWDFFLYLAGCSALIFVVSYVVLEVVVRIARNLWDVD